MLAGWYPPRTRTGPAARKPFSVSTGPEDSIKGTLGLLCDYPHGRPHTLEVNSRIAPTDGWLAYPVTSRWIPDAFAGPMGSLLRAMATAGTPYPQPATIWVRSD